MWDGPSHEELMSFEEQEAEADHQIEEEECIDPS